MIDLFVPPTVQNGARRLSTILLTLAVFALFLFPDSARAGTETLQDRYVLTGLLAAAGLALRFLPAHTFLVLVLHGALQLFLGAMWAVVLSAGAIGYAALALLRMRRSGAPPATDEEEREVHVADVVKENVEAIAMALVIALACREFLYEAFLIPTASMEPTILGRDVREGRKHGDRLLATKIPLMTGDPPRWSIVVFKYPLYRRVNYIKRVVGLPGERVELRKGDVYVDGEVVAKPEEIQNQLWFAEYPLRGQPTPLGRAFTNEDENALWQLGSHALSSDVPVGTSSYVHYDETLASTETDLRVGADVDVTSLDDEGAVLLRVEGAGRRVDLAVGRDGATLTAPGIDAQSLEGVALSDGGRVALGVADRVVRVWIDGHLVARVRHDDEANGGETMPQVSLGLTGAAATFSNVRVARDLQYTKSRTWDVPDDSFIMLGDNTISSKDSREWTVNEVTTADGRVYRGESLVKLEDDSTVRFRESDDGHYEFIDVDGIFRRIPVEGTTVEYDVRYPFVRRRDLIARAFVTFFPFPPFGPARLHFLP